MRKVMPPSKSPSATQSPAPKRPRSLTPALDKAAEEEVVPAALAGRVGKEPR